jgi:hypothetical protein
MAQPSMSKAQQLLQCSWAFNNPVVPRVEANEYMRYGSAYHELVAVSLENGVAPQLSLAAAPNIAEKFNVDVEELKAHAAPAYERFIEWLSGGNPWGAKLLPVPKGAIIIEKSVALHVPTGKARFIANPDEQHIYQEAGEGDHPGTVDVAIDFGRYGKRLPERLRDAVGVFDHKTGLTFDPPRENAQLKSLGVAFVRIWKRRRAVLGIVHAHRESVPEVYVDEVSGEVLDAHAESLKQPFARIGDGSMRPGSSCDWCAGNSVCPTRGGSLVQIASLVSRQEEPLVETAREKLGVNGGRKYIDLDTPDGAGLAHMILQFTRKVDDEWSARIKANVRKGLVAVRPDGKLLELKQTQRENLSLASLRRALERKKITQKRYDELEKQLRDIGAIEVLEREELRAVDDR